MSHAEDLRSALDALEVVVAVRLEERRGTGGLGGPLAATDPSGAREGIAPRTRYPGRIGEVVMATGLSDAEALVLVAALATQVDERFAVLLGRLSADQRPGLTGEVARTLVARTLDARLAATALLDPAGPLVASGLLRLDPPDDLSGRVLPDPQLTRWVLGLPPAGPAPPSADFPARPLTTVHTLDDVVLAGAARRRVRDLQDRIAHRELVVDGWGFGRHHDHAAGLVALFHGPSGTGKTMTAAALARSAGQPAYLVDLSALVSKYIGETEKALSRVFDRAVRERCMLVFDEADAVFGRRTEVSDSHDRYANQEVSYLLSRIEEHPGVVVLTTNLLANIDEAFQRRVHVMVEFPEPGPAERARLWGSTLPRALPVAPDLDLAGLAQRYPLTGAQIRDASLDAAYRAAADGRVVTQEYLVSGVHRQFEKAGRSVPR